MGLTAHNPQTDIARLLDEVEGIGAAGVTNEPFAGLYGAAFNAELERSGCGFSREVALIEGAVSRRMLALGWACDPSQSARLGDAGADLVGLMLGITQRGEGDALDQAAHAIDAMAEAARRTNPAALLLVHGGPLDQPDAVAFILARCAVQGYVTGSSLERGPVLEAVASRMRAFRATSTAPGQ